MDESEARSCAESVMAAPSTLGVAVELREGWYLTIVPNRLVLGGCSGVVVNKRTGKLLMFGPRYEPRDLALYDRGYQFDRYDLVVTGFSDREQALAVLRALSLTIVIPDGEWRIPRARTETELAAILATGIAEDVKLRPVAELLEQARTAGVLEVELREHVESGD